MTLYPSGHFDLSSYNTHRHNQAHTHTHTDVVMVRALAVLGEVQERSLGLTRKKVSSDFLNHGTQQSHNLPLTPKQNVVWVNRRWRESPTCDVNVFHKFSTWFTEIARCLWTKSSQRLYPLPQHKEFWNVCNFQETLSSQRSLSWISGRTWTVKNHHWRKNPPYFMLWWCSG